MAGNFQNILDHRNCIPEDKLLEYIAGRLSPQEANRVEQHLLECELCSDALEGLKMLHPDKSKEITAELNRKIDARLENVKGGKVVQFSSFYRIAAILVLAALFGGGYWLVRNTSDNKSIALNESGSLKKDSLPIQFESPAGSIAVPETVSVKKEYASTTPKFLPENKNVAAQTATSEAAKDINDTRINTHDGAKSKNDIAIIQTDSFYSGDEIAMAEREVNITAQNQASNAIEDYHSSQGAPAAETKSAGKSMDNMSKKSAAFDVTSDTLNNELLFNRGKSNYDKKKFDIAANDFEKLIKDTSSKYYDDSKWFLANCYMRTNRTIQARKLLQEISNSNSVHKREAFGLLQEN